MFLLILVVLFSFNVYAQENTAEPEDLNIMEVVLFLNVNQVCNDATNCKADYDKKTLEYFDEDGRLIEESYIDEDNAIVNKKYDKEGQVISEIKVTEESFMDMVAGANEEELVE
ncbi:hypothetical protein ACFL2Y_02515 [Candidatus Omnitrophota bacterium]